MAVFFTDYYWKDGFPIGIKGTVTDLCYKIISDPYRKYLSIESYCKGAFKNVIYDSRLLDFRHLKPVDQVGWEKVKISEKECLIRDHHDRVVYLERYSLENGLCRECSVFTPHGILLSMNRLHYTLLGDDFNGVVLYDANKHPVMLKKYEMEDGQFTTLLEENTNPYHCEPQNH